MFQLVIALTAAAAALAAQQPAPEAAARAARYEQLYRESPNPTLLWLIAEAHAEAGQEQQALATLEQVAGRGFGFVVTEESPLSRLAGKPEFDRLAARLQREFPIVRNAREVASLAVPRLIPEGIAADSGSTRLFVGDTTDRRVLLVRPGRPAQLFASTGQLRPLGMKVDRPRRLLWVAATTAFSAADKPASALMAFDLASGRLKRSLSSPELKSVNDVDIAPDGDVYLTDSLGGALFRLRARSERIERVTPAAQMSYPNGVAVSGDGRSVYVAQGIRLKRIDTATDEVTTLAQPADLALLSIDGLYWHNGSLIAIQNGGNPGRVLRLDLSPDGAEITAFEVLEAGNPDFDVPTTGAISGNRLTFMANTQLMRLGDDGEITDGPPLKPVKLLEIEIARKAHGQTRTQ